MADEQRRTDYLASCRRNMSPEQFNKFQTLVDWFDVPQHKPSREILTSRNVMELWEMFRGRNERLTEFIQNDLFQTGGYVLELFPHEDHVGKEGVLTRFKFDSQIADEIPDFVPNTLNQYTAESVGYSLADHGSSFRFNEMDFFAPEGQTLFMEQCKNLEKIAATTLSSKVLTSIRHAGATNFAEALTGTLDKTAFTRVVERVYGEYWGSFQKSTRGADVIEAKAYSDLAGQHITPTDSIGPPGTIRYHMFNDQSRLRHDVGGDDIYKKPIDSDRGVIRSRYYPEIRLNESRAYKGPGYTGPCDPMTTYTVIGEKYLAYSKSVVAWEDYTEHHRTITIGHDDRDYEEVTISQLLDAANIFDEQGDLTPTGREILEQCNAWEKANVNKSSKRQKTATISPAIPTDTDSDEVKPVHWKDLFTPAKIKFEPKNGSTAATVWAANGTALEQPFNLDTATRFSSAGIPIPLNFIIFRNNIIFEGGAYVLFRRGKETGVLYTTGVLVELVRNGMIRTIGVNLNFSAACVIHGKKNLAFFPNVYISNYKGGYGSNWWKPGSAGQVEAIDGFVVAVPYNYRNQVPFMDMTGTFAHEMVSLTDDQKEQYSYPTADIYLRLWGNHVDTPTNILSFEHFVEPNISGNTFCWQGWQQVNSGVPGQQVSIQNTIFGKGPLGPVYTPETMTALRGGNATLVNSQFGSVAVRPV